ncbi:hypothetical protein NERG_00425 [Nematocida ausubeli]|uniref:Uncharacterized protein n=1 Tax=Nematocida ausubeli (strain ATCC PRA-371 / ERTm2) TaxID=1913371 RepID=H8ZA04_NEMA1|nr:hypothetical protein NERG_00425 [Nematocida ausubeli]
MFEEILKYTYSKGLAKYNRRKPFNQGILKVAIYMVLICIYLNTVYSSAVKIDCLKKNEKSTLKIVDVSEEFSSEDKETVTEPIVEDPDTDNSSVDDSPYPYGLLELESTDDSSEGREAEMNNPIVEEPAINSNQGVGAAVGIEQATSLPTAIEYWEAINSSASLIEYIEIVKKYYKEYKRRVPEVDANVKNLDTLEDLTEEQKAPYVEIMHQFKLNLPAVHCALYCLLKEVEECSNEDLKKPFKSAEEPSEEDFEAAFARRFREALNLVTPLECYALAARQIFMLIQKAFNDLNYVNNIITSLEPNRIISYMDRVERSCRCLTDNTEALHKLSI